jgi:hypothetical protein
MALTDLCLLLVFVAVLATPAIAQDLDKGYITAFGWGGIAVTQDHAPTLSNYEAGIFHFSGGKFLITAGEDQDLHCRFLLKGGKTYSQHLDALKKSTAAKAATLKDEYIRTLFYVSHNEAGSQLFTTWPVGINDRPKWKEIATDETNYAPAAGWMSSRFSMMEKRADLTALISWITKARPGWKMYIVHVAGYRREAPELKYWDKSLLKWMIPLEYVDTEPLAVATVEIGKSTNSTLAWTCTIEKMPAEQKGVKDGVMAVLKEGKKLTTFKFGIAYSYLNQVTKLHNFTVHYETADGNVIGGFYADGVPSIEAGIQNTFLEAIKRATSEGKVQ